MERNIPKPGCRSQNVRYRIDNGIVFSKKINPAIVDAIYSATKYVRDVKGLDEYEGLNMTVRYGELIDDESFQDAISKRTTNINTIKIRMNKAAEILYGVSYEW